VSRLVAWLLVAAALVAAVVLAALSYRTIDRSLTEAALSRRDAVAYLAATNLAERFDRLTDIGVALATRVRFSQLVGAGRWDEAIQILKDVPRDFPFIDRVVLTDRAGTLMADLPRAAAGARPDPAELDWYRGVSAQWQPYVSNVYTRTVAPRLNVIGVAVPIRAGSNAVAGILLLQVRIDRFLQWAQEIDFGEHGVVYVVDRKGYLASHPTAFADGKTVDYSHAPPVRQVLRGARGVEIVVDPATGEERVAAYAPIARYGWGVVAEQPRAVAFAAKGQVLTSVVAAYALVAALLAGLAYLAGHVMLERQRRELSRRVQDDLERRVAERTADLEAVNRELVSISYSVSHDLRAPLRAIDGFSRLLEIDYGERLDAEAQRRIGVIRTSTARMAELIDDLLEFTHTGRHTIMATDIDMTALAREVADALHANLPQRSAQVVLHPLPPAHGDRVLVRQVLTHLLSNALKFTHMKSDAVIEVGGHVAGREATYYVKDNGAGFDMAHYDKLFGLFQRLHGVHEFPGAGIGLAIARRAVARHGGRIWAEGKTGVGATFWFTLPPAQNANTALP
jgi:signal transduction histidine kinase